MNLLELFTDKSIKPKAKTETIANGLLSGTVSLEALIDFAKQSKDPIKASCIEAIEFSTKERPNLANKKCFDFITQSLIEKAPRIKWEGAKVMGHIAFLFPIYLEKPIVYLLTNAQHEGTVVRWSAAYALGEIIQLKTTQSKKIISAIKNISEREDKNSIRKIYDAALKKIK